MASRTTLNALGSCNICGYKKFEKIADRLRGPEPHKVYKCISCGHVQLLPRPKAEEEKRFYDENRQDRAIRKEINLENLEANSSYDNKRRADFIARKFSRNSKILDIGCGYGFFLKEMAGRGYRISGVEVSRERRELAKTVTDCIIFDINFAETSNAGIGKFDIATLFHVLEHTVEPIVFCRNIRNVLKEKGCLILEVPNVEELMLETSPDYNEFYWNRAHLNYFNRESLKNVLKKAGYRKVETLYIQRYGVENLCSWLMTGKPQIEKPVFEIEEPYRWLEEEYRRHLSKIGRSDTLLAIAYK